MLSYKILFSILATSDQCTKDTRDRKLCMYDTVGQDACENEGCCYDSTISPNCYYSNDESMFGI